ncbi:hypothetical protein ACFL56_00045 [Candidatus Margulisiibacteriota bacterium]
MEKYKYKIIFTQTVKTLEQYQDEIKKQILRENQEKVDQRIFNGIKPYIEKITKRYTLEELTFEKIDEIVKAIAKELKTTEDKIWPYIKNITFPELFKEVIAEKNKEIISIKEIKEIKPQQKIKRKQKRETDKIEKQPSEKSIVECNTTDEFIHAFYIANNNEQYNVEITHVLKTPYTKGGTPKKGKCLVKINISRLRTFNPSLPVGISHLFYRGVFNKKNQPVTEIYGVDKNGKLLHKTPLLIIPMKMPENSALHSLDIIKEEIIDNREEVFQELGIAYFTADTRKNTQKKDTTEQKKQNIQYKDLNEFISKSYVACRDKKYDVEITCFSHTIDTKAGTPGKGKKVVRIMISKELQYNPTLPISINYVIHKLVFNEEKQPLTEVYAADKDGTIVCDTPLFIIPMRLNNNEYQYGLDIIKEKIIDNRKEVLKKLEIVSMTASEKKKETTKNKKNIDKTEITEKQIYDCRLLPSFIITSYEVYVKEQYNSEITHTLPTPYILGGTPRAGKSLVKINISHLQKFNRSLPLGISQLTYRLIFNNKNQPLTEIYCADKKGKKLHKTPLFIIPMKINEHSEYNSLDIIREEIIDNREEVFKEIEIVPITADIKKKTRAYGDVAIESKRIVESIKPSEFKLKVLDVMTSDNSLNQLVIRKEENIRFRPGINKKGRQYIIMTILKFNDIYNSIQYDPQETSATVVFLYNKNNNPEIRVYYGDEEIKNADVPLFVFPVIIDEKGNLHIDTKNTINNSDNLIHRRFVA